MKYFGLLLFVLWLPSCLKANSFSDQLCKPNEEVVLSFYLEKDKKTVCICKEKSGKYLVYRYGTKDKVETEFPESLDESSWKKFIFYADVIPEPGGKESGSFELIINTWKYQYSISEIRTSTSLDLSLEVKDYTKEDVEGNQAIVLSGTAKAAIGSLKQLEEDKLTRPLSKNTYGGWNEIIRHRASKPALVKNRKWKSVTYYEASYSKGKEKWQKRHYYEFSPAGKVLKDVEAGTEDEDDYSRGSWRQEFETTHFDKKGRLVEEKHFENQGESDSIYLYSKLYGYNEKGQMISTSYKNAEGEVTLTHTIRYNEQGNDIEYIDHFNKSRWTRTFDSYGRQLTNKEFRDLHKLVKVDSTVYSQADNQLIMEYYNKELNNGKFQITGYSKFVSDARGKFLNGQSQHGYDENHKTITGSKLTYNSLGLLEQKVTFTQSDYMLENRTQYFYNSKNDLIKEITYSGTEPVSGNKWDYVYY